MKLKKTLSAILAGLMLVGGAISASAGPVYSGNDCSNPAYVPNYSDFYKYYAYYPYFNGYHNGFSGNYYNGYFYNWIYDNGCNLEAYWNPITGRFDTCTCAYCSGSVIPSGYYWVNGVLCSAKDYFIKYAPHTVTVKPATGETSKETGIIYNESSIPNGVIKRKPTAEPKDENVVITESGSVSVKNPAILGGYKKPVTIPGKYYSCDKVDLNAFFNKNTYTMYLAMGDVQTMGTGFKMISSNNAVVRVVTDEDGQHIKAVGMGNASVYLYTGGGVPFMKLNVYVSNNAYNAVKGYIDIEPASWRLDGAGSSTDLIVSADKNYTDIKLEVAKGNGYIGQDGKLYATGDGAIVLKAYSAKYTNIVGYAIVYVGKYVDALYEGYWTNVNGNISCNYWNPNLWCYDGYKINGWILTNSGVYLPVISRVETTTTKPDGTTTSTTTTVYSDLYDLLYDCHGDVDTMYKLLWLKYVNSNKPVQNFGTMYQTALEEILKDIADNYFAQLH